MDRVLHAEELGLHSTTWQVLRYCHRELMEVYNTISLTCSYVLFAFILWNTLLTVYLIASLLQLVENQIHMVNSYVAWLVGWVNHMKANCTKPDPPPLWQFPQCLFCPLHLKRGIPYLQSVKVNTILKVALLKGKCF